jgi:hypothetical protein
MLRKLFFLVIAIPTAALLVAAAVANRHLVAVSFDPFDAANPAFAVDMPLCLVGFVMLFAGVVLGGFATWIRQGKWRRLRTRMAAELAAARAELDRVKRQAERDGDPAARRPGSGPRRLPAA